MRYKGTTTERLDRIERVVRETRSNQSVLLDNQNTLFEGELEIMSQLTDALDFAESKAADDANADHAAMELIKKLGQLVIDSAQGGTDPALVARVKAIGEGMKSRADALAAAVVAGTPAEVPVPEPAPVPPEPPAGGESTGGIVP
jgi:hypothetical protein